MCTKVVEKSKPPQGSWLKSNPAGMPMSCRMSWLQHSGMPPITNWWGYFLGTYNKITIQTWHLWQDLRYKVYEVFCTDTSLRWRLRLLFYKHVAIYLRDLACTCTAQTYFYLTADAILPIYSPAIEVASPCSMHCNYPDIVLCSNSLSTDSWLCKGHVLPMAGSCCNRILKPQKEKSSTKKFHSSLIP